MYGKVICVWFYHEPLISVCDPDLVKYLMVTKNAPKPINGYKPLSEVFGKRCLGQGLATECDEKRWSLDRKTFNPVFHRQCLKDMMSAFNRSTDLFINKLLKISDGQQEIMMVPEFSKIALDVICKVAFGMDVDLVNDTTNQLPDAVINMMQGVEKSIYKPFEWLNPFAWQSIKNAHRGIDFVRETGKKVIEVRMLAMNHGEQVPNDILQNIIALQEKAGPTDFERMLDHFVTFFIAGHETTASQMAFCLLEIADNEEIRETLVDEISRVLGDRKYVEFDDLAKMHKLGNALKETLRLYPSAPGFVREVGEDDVLAGIPIPSHTSVLVSSYVSGRFPEFWVNAEDFNPMRFEDDEQVARSHFTMFPFSLGPRSCIGQHFAKIEAKVVLARFLQTFKVKLAPGQTKTIAENMTYKPRDGVVCRLTRRT
ncbi:cholesterol 24-hydroxylase isoform X2 [Nematostella vectensis]|nr:cholesterol 24-hydroxylase isoform X2 [Nematostella vectensis]